MANYGYHSERCSYLHHKEEIAVGSSTLSCDVRSWGLSQVRGLSAHGMNTYGSVVIVTTDLYLATTRELDYYLCNVLGLL